MEENSVQAIQATVAARRRNVLRTLQWGPLLAIVLAKVLAWIVGSGDVGVVNLAPRPAIISTETLCFLAVLGGVGLALAVVRTLPACLRLVLRGDWDYRGPIFILGSVSTMLICWSLWDWRGTLCTWVFVAGVALTDGAILLSLLWSVTGGKLLHAGGTPRQAA